MKGGTMEVLTTRTFGYTDKSGAAQEVVVTIFVPYEIEEGYWRCEYVLSPPFDRKNLYSAGVDFLQAFQLCLEIIPAAVRLEVRTQAQWQGMPDCGLPQRGERERPASYHPPDVPPPEDNPGDLEVLATRKLVCQDEMGVERALLLTLYKPFQAAAETWKCAFALGPTESAPVRYGIGADFIDAFLDALVLARVAHEAMIPDGRVTPLAEDLHDCSGFPYKIGRSYWSDPAPALP